MAWCDLHRCSGISVCERTDGDTTIKIFQCNFNGHYWFEKWKKIQKENINDIKTKEEEVLIRVANNSSQTKLEFKDTIPKQQARKAVYGG